MLLRVRVGSFLAGFAVASGLALLQIRQDIMNSSEFLATQAKDARDTLELRVGALESVVAQLQGGKAAAAGAPQPARAD